MFLLSAYPFGMMDVKPESINQSINQSVIGHPKDPDSTTRGFISTWVYFHFFYFLGRAKGPGKREGAQIASHS
jgi:hypothetical protein